MPRADGVDVSQWQGTIDWHAVPQLDFVVAKATQRGKDPTFDRNWAGMRARGFRTRGAYHFNDNPNVRTAAQQAATFRATVGELVPGEFPALDFEPWEDGGVPVYTERQARDLRDAVEDVFQREAMIYCGYQAPAMRVVEGRPWWFPSYGISHAGMLRQAAHAGVDPTVWQWGGGGVPGVGTAGVDFPGITPATAEDTNQIEQLDRLLAWAGQPGPGPTPPAPTRRSDAMTTPFVLGGTEERPYLDKGGVLHTWWTWPEDPLTMHGGAVTDPTPGQVFIGLGEAMHVGDDVVWIDAMSEIYGGVPVTIIVRGSHDHVWSVHGTEELRRFLASVE